MMASRRRKQTLLSLLLLFLSVSFALSVSTFADDLSLMQQIATLLKPPGWSDTGDPCNPEWRGVKCDAGRVVAINLQSKVSGGSLPARLNKLTQLKTLSLQNNAITGSLPTLADMANLEEVYLDGNNFSTIPPKFFYGLTSLRTMSLNGNALSAWEISPDLAQSTSLTEFYASNAGVSGFIPSFFGELPSLQSLRLSYNNISGELPASFATSTIQNLWLNNQISASQLTGPIHVLASMSMLVQVWLHANSFSGPVPDLSKCTSLTDLQLRDNQLTGVLPPSLFSLPSLVNVSLGNNKFQGPFPSFKPNVLDDKNIEKNNFCDTKPGPCDPRVMVLLSVEEAFGYPAKLVDAWTGNDPCAGWLFVSCDAQKKEVTMLTLPNQHLVGTISRDLANLTSLRSVILSNNNLTGSIPDGLAGLKQLQVLDLTNNNLSGKVPNFGAGVNVKLSGNPFIGKDVPTGTGPSGSTPSVDGVLTGRKTSSFPTWIIVVVVLAIVAMVAILTLIFVKKHKKSKEDLSPLIMSKMGKTDVASSNGNAAFISEPTSLGSSGHNEIQMAQPGSLVIPIQVLRQVTQNFNEDHVLGRGGFGVVYKGELQDGTQIAVKRMESAVVSSKGMNEFQAEIAVLTKVRHRHLVALLCYCVEDNERLLVYEYMPQGTLGEHLFEWKDLGYEPLTWKQRLTIALDVARGVEYLHGLAQTSFIHRDLKPSNILLGNDMRAKVSDFGLVKLAPDGKYSVETRLAGTFGYLAPEYCATGRVTTKADVYSFGVILMELITGRKVLDDDQPEERTHLVTWFRRVMINKDNMLKALDPTLNPEDDTFVSISKVAELAGHCTARDPFQRPDMNHAVNILSPLIEQWRPTGPTGPGEDDDGGINFHMSLSEAVERWQSNEGTSITGDLLYNRMGTMGNTDTSIEPSAFPHSFASNNAR